MKLSTDQLITWSFVVGVAAERFSPEDENRYREVLSKLKGRERAGISSGVKEGANGLLRMAYMLPLEKYEKVEIALCAKGLPSLDQMEAFLQRKHAKILKRGKIKDDEEYYLVVEMLSDTPEDLTDKQREQLGEMIVQYEDKTGPAN